VSEGGQPQLVATYQVTDRGIDITVEGASKNAPRRAGHLLPAFLFDGEAHTVVTRSDDQRTLEIALGGWVCRYTTDGVITDAGYEGYSRNGYFHAYRAEKDGCLHVHIEIVRT
jgi:hypothetical protein